MAVGLLGLAAGASLVACGSPLASIGSPSTVSAVPKACDLLTDSIAQEVLGFTAQLDQVDEGISCSYAPHGADRSTRAQTQLIVGYKSIDDAAGLPNGHPRDSGPQAVDGLGPGAVLVTSHTTATPSDGGSDVVMHFLLVAWQARSGDVEQLSVSFSTDVDGAQDRLVAQAKRIYDQQTGSTDAPTSSAGSDAGSSGDTAVPALNGVDAACPWAVQGDNPPAIQDGGDGLQPLSSVLRTPTATAVKCATARAEAAGFSVLPDTDYTKKLLAPGTIHVVLAVGTETDVVPLYMNVSTDPDKAPTCWASLLVYDYQGNYLFIPSQGFTKTDTLDVAASEMRTWGLFSDC